MAYLRCWLCHVVSQELEAISREAEQLSQLYQAYLVKYSKKIEITEVVGRIPEK